MRSLLPPPQPSPTHRTPGLLRKYVIVRDIPDIGSKSQQELASISATSCKALDKTGFGSVQWVHSYVTGDK